MVENLAALTDPDEIVKTKKSV